MRLDEARRVMTVCAVCNYCNGFCETFRAAERRNAFTDGDLVYLAHLCHNCGNCWSACQYAPPHVFDVNVPKVLAEVRRQSWGDRPWLALFFVLLLPALTLAFVPSNTLFAAHTGPGAFYTVLPLPVLVTAGALSLAWGVTVLALGVRRFWRISGGGFPWQAMPAALGDMLTLRNLGGGGIACEAGAARRLFHHALAYGFAMCFGSTAAATVYHHVFGWEAPYPLVSLPVLLGLAGGLGMLTGCAGLAFIKAKADAALDPAPNDYKLLALLSAVALSGLALLAFRDTNAMGLLLAVHLGCVAGFFITLPYGKFAHAPFRAAALLRTAMERRKARQV